MPKSLKNNGIIVGGRILDDITYGDCQKEMDMVNMAFCQVFEDGDAVGNIFTFPIPTLNVTKDWDWDSPVIKSWLKVAAKYGIPYFANYINSDLDPEDAISMCCRLRLEITELRKRGGGLFGSNPLTGSIGVVTINLPRLGYLARTKSEFKALLLERMELARMSLVIKRQEIEKMTEKNMYPYCKVMLQTIKDSQGAYWANHFNTIGIIGMHEACINLLCDGIQADKSREFAIEIMDYMRDILMDWQQEDGQQYNLEATPAEGTCYRLAKKDKDMYADIYTSGVDNPYYTNSTQLPVFYTDNIEEMLDHQDELQCKYTGGRLAS